MTVWESAAAAAADPSSFENAELVIGDTQGEYERRDGPISAKQLAEIVLGALRSDVLAVLGDPLLGKGNDRWWFYNINFPQGDAGDYLHCQYRVAFNSLDQVSGRTWSQPQCEAVFRKLSRPEVRVLTLSGDVLFAFDSAAITPEGASELLAVTKAVRNKMQLQLIRLEIEGHADRLGGDDYNLRLSNQRAAAVKNFLAVEGVATDRVVSSGRGSREPVVVCPGKEVTVALKECLKPNRRVEIVVYGESKEEIKLD